MSVIFLANLSAINLENLDKLPPACDSDILSEKMICDVAISTMLTVKSISDCLVDIVSPISFVFIVLLLIFCREVTII